MLLLVTVQGRMTLVTAQLLLKGKDESPNVANYLAPCATFPAEPFVLERESEGPRGQTTGRQTRTGRRRTGNVIHTVTEPSHHRTVGPLMIYDSAKRSSAHPRSPCLRMRRTCSQVVRSVSKVDYSLYLDESRGLKASGTDSPIRRI